MRQRSTWLIVAAVALLAGLAAADALRGSGDGESRQASPATTAALPPTLAQTLREEGIAGFLTYSDSACVLHSLLVPQMTDEVVRGDDGLPSRMCRFTVGGGRYLEDRDVPSPDGRLVARCQGGRVVVRDLESGLHERSLRGCPPAWRPDGRLTYPQGDRIMEEDHVLFAARDLRAAARSHPNLQDFGGRLFVHATALSWLDEERVILSLEAFARYLEPQYLTAMFQGKTLVGAASRFGQVAANWIVSPSGAFAAADDGTVVTRAGDFTDPPDGLPDGRAVAFSPDERWLAYVSGVSIYLIGTPSGERGRIIRLPVEAQDLIWEPPGRGSATGPPIRR